MRPCLHPACNLLDSYRKSYQQCCCKFVHIHHCCQCIHCSLIIRNGQYYGHGYSTPILLTYKGLNGLDDNTKQKTPINKQCNVLNQLEKSISIQNSINARTSTIGRCCLQNFACNEPQHSKFKE